MREPRSNAAVTEAFDRLPTEEQSLYLTLHAVDPSSQGPARVVDIFNSNAWQTGDYTSILVRAARFNHSCVPNASFAWNPRLERVTITAVVDIPAGTEIYLSYELPYQTQSQRLKKLSSYGFECSCVSCTSGVVASNKARLRMTALDARIRINRRRKDLVEMPTDALELVELLKLEGLVGEALGLAYHDVAAGWRKYGRLDLAVQYALKELSVCIMCFGSDSPYVDATRAFLQRLEVELSTSTPGIGDTPSKKDEDDKLVPIKD